MAWRWFGWFRKPIKNKVFTLDAVDIAEMSPPMTCCPAPVAWCPEDEGIHEELEKLDIFFDEVTEEDFSDEVACGPSDFDFEDGVDEVQAKADEQIEAIIADAVTQFPDKKVNAIKQVRMLTGMGLKEAKAAVEESCRAKTIGDLMEGQLRNHVS